MASVGYNYSAEEIHHVLRRRPRGRLASKSRRRKPFSLTSACGFIVQHQLSISLTILALLAWASVVFPSRHTHNLYTLSHYDEPSQSYTPGRDDWAYVLPWLFVFTGLRSAVMDYVLRPLAIRGGVRKPVALERFSEQGWLAIYYTLSFGAGMYLWTTSKYWLNLRELWTDFPDTAMSASMKRYYLIQYAFWIQQILVINIEKRRKDYWQMLTHHLITCALIFTSYGFYMTRVGNAILCLMDFADIILSTAKVLRYLAYQTACDVAFGIFIAAWFITRHIFFPMVVWSVWAHLPVEMPLGCYDTTTRQKTSQPKATSISQYVQPFQDPGGIVCFDSLVHWWFLGLLSTLLCILLVWFVMIINVAWRVISGLGSDDPRSDDEDDMDDEDVVPNEKNRGEKLAS
ncbi:longevity assurance proteins LAG1/LAC1 [Polyplosphaeria fusca]|uniref:Longevity assurance proteins LAG1/LAC1 n=1 Tax=Polyplosphaeria fusca TaxID=682080 RepID=A0A9P4UYK2_9PLEO|nr:longevity assurance proteins LAG1/LAC1 [Polyplosphaeria fusca]